MKVMNKRLLIFTLFITCVYTTSLFAQDRLGVYAAAFYNLENLWDTVDDPNNKGDDDSLQKESMNGLRPSMNKSYRILPR